MFRPVATSFARCVLALVLLASGANWSAGQVASEPFSARGKVAGVAPGIVQIVDVTGRRIEVRVNKPGEQAVELSDGRMIAGILLQAKVRGEMSFDQIRPTMAVRFKAAVDSKGVVPDPVAELAVFEPSAFDPVGMFADPDAIPQTERMLTAYLVKGLVITSRRRVLTLSVGTMPPPGIRSVTVTIAPDAKVAFESDSILSAQPGDDISVEGSKIGNDLVGSKMEVTRAAVQAAQAPKTKPTPQPQPKQSPKTQPKPVEPKPQPKPAQPAPADPAPDLPPLDPLPPLDEGDAGSADSAPNGGASKPDPKSIPPGRTPRTTPGRVVTIN